VRAQVAEEGLAWATPGMTLILEVEGGMTVGARIIANHLGGYLYLVEGGDTFWVWDGYTRLCQLAGWERDVAVTLAGGRVEAAIPLVLKGWRDEMGIRMQGGGKLPETPEAGALNQRTADIWFAVTVRFAEMVLNSVCDTPLWQRQRFLPLLPCAGRFVRRAVTWDALKAYLIMETAMLPGDAEPGSFYRAYDGTIKLGSRVDPLSWSDDHPIMRYLDYAFEVLYLGEIPYVGRDETGDLCDAFAPLRDDEIAGEAWDTPEWLLVFAERVGRSVRDRATNERIGRLLDGVRTDVQIMAVLTHQGDVRMN